MTAMGAAAPVPWARVLEDQPMTRLRAGLDAAPPHGPDAGTAGGPGAGRYAGLALGGGRPRRRAAQRAWLALVAAQLGVLGGAALTGGGCRRNPSKLDPTDAGAAPRTGSRDLAALAARFDRQCVAGDLEACRNLAVLYAEGKGVPADRRRAAALWGQACDGGNLSACNALALALAEGLGVERQAAKAVEVYQRACDGGYQLACRNLGLMLRDGAGVPADLDRAYALLDRACTGGVPFACTNLGDLEGRRASSAKDPVWFKAIDHYKAACEAGDATGCRQIGVAYLEGNTSLPRSAGAAGVWLDRACTALEPVACRVLATMQQQGLGVRRDAARARSTMDRACRAHDDEACRLLATMPTAGAGDAPPNPATGGAGSASAPPPASAPDAGPGAGAARSTEAGRDAASGPQGAVQLR